MKHSSDVPPTIIFPLASTGVEVELNPKATLPTSEILPSSPTVSLCNTPSLLTTYMSEPSATTVVRTRSATFRLETTQPVAASMTLTVPESSAITPKSPEKAMPDQ